MNSDARAPEPHPSLMYVLCSQSLPLLPTQAILGSDQERERRRTGVLFRQVYCALESFPKRAKMLPAPNRDDLPHLDGLRFLRGDLRVVVDIADTGRYIVATNIHSPQY